MSVVIEMASHHAGGLTGASGCLLHCSHTAGQPANTHTHTHISQVLLWHQQTSWPRPQEQEVNLVWRSLQVILCPDTHTQTHTQACSHSNIKTTWEINDIRVQPPARPTRAQMAFLWDGWCGCAGRCEVTHVSSSRSVSAETLWFVLASWRCQLGGAYHGTQC